MASILDRDEEFEQFGKDKSLVITALALERMWVVFINGVYKTDYIEEERILIIKIAEELMQMIWGRVERGYALSSDYDRFGELVELMNSDLFETEATVNDADLDPNASELLDNIVVECADSFLVEETFLSGRCKEVVESVFNMVMEGLESYLFHNVYKSSYEIKEKNEELSDYILGHHPALVDEILRVEADKAMAQDYPHNMKEILEKRAEYHKLNLLDFKPLEEYGFQVEVI